MINKTQRIINADTVRVLAMTMVILLHTVLNFTIRTDFFATKLYFLLEPIVAISKTCVLLFFMLSGFLVISKKRSIGENNHKTFKKILIPLGFFAVINIICEWLKFDHNTQTTSQFITQQIQRISHFPSSSLWFLVILIFLYLLNPVWQIIFDKNQKPKLARITTLGFLFFSLMITIIQFKTQNTEIFNNLTAWTGFVFFYLYGGLVKNKWLEINHQILNVTLIVVGLMLTIVGDYLTMQHLVFQTPSVWDGYTGNYLSLPVTIMAVGIFNLLMSLDLSKLRSDFLIWLSGLSFGIYLTHTYAVSLLTDAIGFDFNKLNINVYAYNLLNILLVFSISLGITLLIKKTPKLKMVIGE